MDWTILVAILDFSHLKTNLIKELQKLCYSGGSEIQTSLDIEWSKRGWVANGLEQMLGTIAIVIAKARPFENLTFEIQPSKLRIKNGWISNPHCN